ncbi:MAG: hypothetical protein JWO28_2133 [Hyphomicrobiales bacterium]|nr:hypothetical protein [Hyphomicrobiales bacterium]
MAARTNRTEKVDIRLTPSAKRLLRSAAKASGKNVSNFVLESAISKADEILADRRIITLSAKDWQAFHAALDAPPRPTPRLAREKSILD